MAVQEKQRVLSGQIHMGKKIVAQDIRLSHNSQILLGNANYQDMYSSKFRFYCDPLERWQGILEKIKSLSLNPQASTFYDPCLSLFSGPGNCHSSMKTSKKNQR